MSIQDQINTLAEKHRIIMAGNPSISEIEWKIEGVPYWELESFRKEFNKANGLETSLSSIGGKVCVILNQWRTGVDRMAVTVWSNPVKVKTTVEVLEETA